MDYQTDRGDKAGTIVAGGYSPDLSKMKEALRRVPDSYIEFLEAKIWQRKKYAELADDVDFAIAKLGSLHLPVGSRVGLLGANSYQWIVADLALLAMGLVSVAMPENAPERRRELEERFAVALTLADEALISEQKEPHTTSFRWLTDSTVQSIPVARALQPPGNLDVARSEPAIVFSSGTSGRLKCLRMSKSGLELAMACINRKYQVDRSDRFLVFLPLSNVQQRLMLCSSFWNGVNVILTNPPTMLRGLREKAPTIILAPPLFYEQIHNLALNRMGKSGRLVTSVARVIFAVFTRRLRMKVLRRIFRPIHVGLGGAARLMITGMAPTRRSTLEFFNSVGLGLYEAYGVTECGLVAGNAPDSMRIGSVGKAFEEGSVSIAPDGEIIVSRAAMMAAGYIDEPDESSVYLDANTVATGDIGHFDAQGFLYIDGRKKEILITRSGYKVHPELVEAALNDCSAIEKSGVVLSTDGETLFALVVARETDHNDPRAAIQEFVHLLNATNRWGVKISDFHILEESFSVENELLTRNLKLNRRQLERTAQKKMRDL